MDVKNMDEFKKNNPTLLSFDDVLKITKSFFSISPFWVQRKELLQIVTSDNFLFAFKLGVVVTKSEVLFLSSKKLLHIDFTDISKITVDLKKMKIIFEEYDIGIASLNIDKMHDNSNLFLSFQEMFKEKKLDSLIHDTDLIKIIYNETDNVNSIKYYFNIINTESKDGVSLSLLKDKFYQK